MIFFFISQKPFLLSISSTSQLIQENMTTGSTVLALPLYRRQQTSSLKIGTANPLLCLSLLLAVLDNCE